MSMLTGYCRRCGMNWATAGRECASVLALALMFLAMPPEPLAAEEPAAGTLSVVLENDFFYNRDNNYTNGVRVAWLSAPGEAPDWALRAARLFPLFPKEGAVRIGYAIGQDMYTPKDISLRNRRSTTSPMPAGCTVRRD